MQELDGEVLQLSLLLCRNLFPLVRHPGYIHECVDPSPPRKSIDSCQVQDKTQKNFQAEAEIVPESMRNFSAYCTSKGEPPRRPRLATRLCGAWQNVELQEHCQSGGLPFKGLHEALPCCKSGPTALEEAAIAHIVTAKSVRGDRKHHITLVFAH